jgi:hypothetical protein
VIAALWIGLALAAEPATGGAAKPEAPTHVQTALVVQVSDVGAAQDAVIARAESEGGWFSALSDDGVTLQVPVARAGVVEDFARTLGSVVERDYRRDDLSAQLRDQRSALAARQRTLDRYFAVLADANARSVVSVEREINRLVTEIEGYEGRIRVLEHRAAVASVQVSFRFRDRKRPAPAGASSFGWVNSVSLDDLLGTFRYGWAVKRVAGVSAPAPEGFAAWRTKDGLRALSSDDAVWRVRVLRTRQPADLSFWSEALKNRLQETGYVLTGEGDVTTEAGVAGARTEWSAPDGERDAAWLVAIFVDGRRIVVAEAAGEAGVFPAHREAVLSALGRLTF